MAREFAAADGADVRGGRCGAALTVPPRRPRSTGSSATTGPVVATSSAHLSGAPQDRASAALDQDPSTAWVTPFTGVVGQYVDVDLPGADHPRAPRPAGRRRRSPLGPDQARRSRTRPARRVRWTCPRSPTSQCRTARWPRRCSSRRSSGSTLPRHDPGRARRAHARVVLRVRPDDARGHRGARHPRRRPDPRCRADPGASAANDLITIDGRPVPVRVVGTDRRRAGALTAAACRRAPGVGSARHDDARRRRARPAHPAGQPFRLRRGHRS